MTFSPRRSLLRLSFAPRLVARLALPLAALAAFVAATPVDLAWAESRGAAPPRGAPPATRIVNAEVMVLLATEVEGRGSIDPAIGNVPQLRKPPLSSYNTYRLLDKRNLPLEIGRSTTYPLANGRVLQVTFVEPTPDHGFHVKAAINQPGGNAYLKLLELTAKPNEPFFVAGQSFLGGSLILAVTLRP